VAVIRARREVLGHLGVAHQAVLTKPDIIIHDITITFLNILIIICNPRHHGHEITKEDMTVMQHRTEIMMPPLHTVDDLALMVNTVDMPLKVIYGHPLHHHRMIIVVMLLYYHEQVIEYVVILIQMRRYIRHIILLMLINNHYIIMMIIDIIIADNEDRHHERLGVNITHRIMIQCYELVKLVQSLPKVVVDIEVHPNHI